MARDGAGRATRYSHATSLISIEVDNRKRWWTSAKGKRSVVAPGRGGQEHECDQPAGERIRIVGFHVEPDAYQMVATWAAARGYELALVVTTAGPVHTDYDGHNAILATAPRAQDVLATTKLKRAALPIAAYAPDIILSYTFPYRLPPEILAIPRLGAVNLHPSALPAYRGPNPHRMLYDGAPTLGATLHRTAKGFDTGAILSRHEAPPPQELTVDRVRAVWNHLMYLALDQGVLRAIAGEPGTPQDHAAATYAASFAPEEYWLDWTWSMATLERRVVALNLIEPRARATIDGAAFTVLAARPVVTPNPVAKPGTALGQTAEGYQIAVSDGAVDLILSPESIADSTPADPPVTPPAWIPLG